MIFTSEDFTTDTKYNPISVKDAAGKELTLNMWPYAFWFAENIQETVISKEEVYVDGVRIDCFVDLFIKENRVRDIEKYILDHTCEDFQKQMSEKYNVHVNVVALYALCCFIKEIINRRLALLLKPSIKETLEEIGEKEHIKDITFSLGDGKSHTSSAGLLKETLVKALKETDDSSYEFYKVVKKVDVYSKEYGQIEFVRFLSKFFHEYFKIHRRKNSYLTSEEQHIIRYFLNYFGFAPVIATESRFRQLFNSKVKPVDHFFPLNIPGVFESNCVIYLELLTYSEWKNGRINPLHHTPADIGKLTIQMGKNPDVSEIIKIAKDCYGPSSINCKFS